METFTAEEIAEIVHELGLPAEIEVDEDGFVSIEVVTDDLEWTIYLGDNGPFFGSIALGALKLIDEDPLAYANNWNRKHIAPVVVFDNPATESPIVDDDGNVLVQLHWRN